MVVQRPHVVAHVAVSLDGATTGFEPDLGRFYGLVATWQEDVTLTGADTVLAQESALAAAPGPGPNPDGALLAVVDGRGRVREWAALRAAGFWRDVLAVHAARTPPRPADRAVEELVVGDERVDLAGLLTELGRRGTRVVRVDSGGGLLGALLGAGLVDELSLLVHPVLAGGGPRWWGPREGPRTALALVGTQAFDDGVLWLRHRVVR
jgi:2,5-diamino-6-(ribosylamino)-4(3H)-pyrimidinone 5'-phosphate reductase